MIEVSFGNKHKTGEKVKKKRGNSVTLPVKDYLVITSHLALLSAVKRLIVFNF